MKKILIAGIIAFVAVLVLGAAGFVYAQTQNPPTPGSQSGRGMMGGGGGGMMGGTMMGGGGGGMMGGGMMGSGNGAYGQMHTYMLEAFSAKLSLTTDEVQERMNGGETMWQIAQSTGLGDEEINALMLEARTKALNQMVADGIITQEQADWMVEHMNGMHANGFGPESCHGEGRRGPEGRWNQQPEVIQ